MQTEITLIQLHNESRMLPIDPSKQMPWRIQHYLSPLNNKSAWMQHQLYNVPISPQPAYLEQRTSYDKVTPKRKTVEGSRETSNRL